MEIIAFGPGTIRSLPIPAAFNQCRRWAPESAITSHGENRGSSPLGSASKTNNLNKVSLRATNRCLLFVYYP